jgi:hypothetical protein
MRESGLPTARWLHFGRACSSLFQESLNQENLTEPRGANSGRHPLDGGGAGEPLPLLARFGLWRADRMEIATMGTPWNDSVTEMASAPASTPPSWVTSSRGSPNRAPAVICPRSLITVVGLIRDVKR